MVLLCQAVPGTNGRQKLPSVLQSATCTSQSALQNTQQVEVTSQLMQTGVHCAQDNACFQLRRYAGPGETVEDS